MAIAKPFFPSTHTDHAGWLVAIAITFLIYSIFGVGATIANRMRMGSLKIHDWFIIAALIFQFIQAIVITRACVDGFGKHQLILSASAVDTVRKDFFASDILSIFVYTLAKLFVILFFMTINSRQELNRAGLAAFGVIVAWGVSSIFLLSFRCGTSRPWSEDEDKCLSDFGVYLGIDVGNIATDLTLIVLPVIMMWNLKLAMRMKAQVMALFATRILVILVLIIHIGYINIIKQRDLTWTMVEPSIIGEVALSLSILTACVPSLKSGIEAFFSGASQFVVPGEYTSSQTQFTNYGLGSRAASKLRGFGKSAQLSKNHSRLENSSKSGTHSFLRSRDRGGEQPDTALERSESQTNLHEHHIVRTTEFDVAYESGDNAPSGGGDGLHEGSWNSTGGYHAKIY